MGPLYVQGPLFSYILETIDWVPFVTGPLLAPKIGSPFCVKMGICDLRNKDNKIGIPCNQNGDPKSQLMKFVTCAGVKFYI